jgi:hypothetical protein
VNFPVYTGLKADTIQSLGLGGHSTDNSDLAGGFGIAELARSISRTDAARGRRLSPSTPTRFGFRGSLNPMLILGNVHLPAALRHHVI